MATVHLTFYINLTDQERVRELQAQYPNGVIRGPQPAALEFDAPYITRADPFVVPSTITAWHPGETSGKFFYDRAVFRIGSGGFFGLFGANTRYVWVGQFRYMPATDVADTEVPGATEPTEVEPIPQRRFIEGFSMTSATVTGFRGSGTGAGSRVAARHVDGFGGTTRSAAASTIHDIHDFGAIVDADRHMDRFYVRPRRLSGANVEFYVHVATGATGGEGIKLYLAPTGQVIIYGVVNGGAESLAGVGPTLTLNEWHKLEVALWFKAPSGGLTTCQVKLYLNGELQATVTPTVHSSGIALAANSSRLLNTGSGHSAEIDVADWVGMEVPKRVQAEAWSAAAIYATTSYVTHNGGKVYRALGTGTLPAPADPLPPGDANWIRSLGPIDWFAGSRIKQLHPVAFGAAHDAVAWPGDVRVLDKHEGMVLDVGQSELTSSTGSAVLEVELDYRHEQRGAVCAVAAHFGHASTGGANATLGINVAGADPVPVTPVPAVSGTRAFASTMYRPAGLAAPEDFGLVRVRYVKDATASTHTAMALTGAVEFIGIYGPEDVVLDPDATETPDVPAMPGIHNAPYPESPWANTSTPPLSPVQIFTGTYAGIGGGLTAALEILFRTPIHFLLIRRVDLSGGVWWFSTLKTGHRRGDGSTRPQFMQRAKVDPDYVSAGGEGDAEEQYLVELTGADSNYNASGGTYQYIAIADPGSRFLLNGAFRHGAHALDNAGVTNLLDDSGFTPVYGLFFREIVATPLITAWHLFAKGLGNSANGASSLEATETANCIAFGAGQITSFANMHGTTYDQVAYALMRAIEPGSADPGVVFQIRTYTGNGAASRTIPLTPASGKRPVFAMVTPANAATIMRDPANTTNNSQPANFGAVTTTGITAGGIDEITVGSTLNANGVEYSVFVIPGSETAGNGGWSIDGEFTPVEAAPAPGSQFPDEGFDEDDIDDVENPPEEEPEEPVIVEEPDLDNTTALPGTALFCADYSRRLVNTALSRIGQSRQVADLVTEQSEAAVVARLHLKTDIEATLRAFDWPFATRYAELAWVAGAESAPATDDWQYAYRAPTGMVKARRIVSQLAMGRSYDPDPIPFRLGSDASGALVYTNAAIVDANTPVVLEYTTRISCPAYFGDPMFKDALIWRIAASLAGPLARDKQIVAFCLTMFKDAIAEAEVAAANEAQHEKNTASGGDAPWITGRN